MAVASGSNAGLRAERRRPRLEPVLEIRVAAAAHLDEQGVEAAALRGRKPSSQSRPAR
jgi:hypothetical protein